jgi:hypothetical protein
MRASLTIVERPLPVVLAPAPDELLSSWLRRHASFYGLTESILISWLNLEVKALRGLDIRLGLAQIARIVERFRTDPKAIVEMTHTPLPPEFAPLAHACKAQQFCRSCWKRHSAANADGAVLKSWFEGWRITCPVCGSPLSEGDRPRGGDDTIQDTSPFAEVWSTAKSGEEIVDRHLRGERSAFVSPPAMMRLLLFLSWPQIEASGNRYRKSWLLNDFVSGFDAEALRVSPSISKGATALVPLHLRVALLAGLARVADNPASALRSLRPACRLSHLKRFDELAAAALGDLSI